MDVEGALEEAFELDEASSWTGGTNMTMYHLSKPSPSSPQTSRIYPPAPVQAAIPVPFIPQPSPTSPG